MEEKIFFTNLKGDKLSGILTLFNPSNLTVIMTAGLRGTKEGNSSKLASMIGEQKINSLRFDFLGHGESEGKYEDITLSEAVDEYLSAIQYLQNRGINNIGLYGTSFGGAAAVLAAAKTDSIKFLALRSPVSDYHLKELLGRSKEELKLWRSTGYREVTEKDGSNYRIKYNFLVDTLNNRGLDVADKIKVPTLIIHGDQDETVPLFLSVALQKAIPNSELRVIEGANHNYKDPELNLKGLNIIADFIKQFKGNFKN